MKEKLKNIDRVKVQVDKEGRCSERIKIEKEID